mmetsp:Transcript_2829/g.4420  ORF Transcript_2829/g.4420 Transcript_2829/m.4420 type:complete len:317 (+) Transcript_2829:37-987(+)
MEAVPFTEKVLKDLCKKHGLYRTPSVNDKLYLNSQGFSEIDGDVLGQYTNLRCLWLQANGLIVVQGLEKLVELRSLYLQENLLEKIEGLETLRNLRELNLSRNFIAKIENLAPHLAQLETLNLGHNNLGGIGAIDHLLELPSLQTLDIQANRLEDGDAVLSILSQLPNLRVLYAQGNTFVKSFKHYRKRFIAACSTLCYMDDRPIFQDERRRVQAWTKVYDVTGDFDLANKAEREELKAIKDEKLQADVKRMQDFEDFIFKESSSTELVTGPSNNNFNPGALHARDLNQEAEGEHDTRPTINTTKLLSFVDFYELD